MITDDKDLTIALLRKENKILRLKLRRGEREFLERYRKRLHDRFSSPTTRQMIDEALV